MAKGKGAKDLGLRGQREKELRTEIAREEGIWDLDSIGENDSGVIWQRENGFRI